MLLITLRQFVDYNRGQWNMSATFISYFIIFIFLSFGITPNHADVFLYKMSQSPGMDLMNPRDRGIHPRQMEQLLIPGMMYRIKLGTKIAFGHCSSLFTWEKWNCTFHSEALYRRTVRKITKETALIYALISAGVSHSIALGCSSGNITCPCLNNRGYPVAYSKDVGTNCNHIQVGMKVAKPFVDHLENILIYQLRMNITTSQGSAKKRLKKRLLKAKINLHNKHVGRQIIKLTANQKCTCHGTSASCVAKTCVRIPKTFKDVGLELKRIYKNAKKLPKLDRRKLKKMYSRLSYGKDYIRRSDVLKPQDSLLYLSNSKNHCYQNLRHGILGTVGRECKIPEDIDGGGSERCSFMCCGRTIHKITSEETFQCKCKFVWCCKVYCEQCKRNVTRYYCGSETHNYQIK